MLSAGAENLLRMGGWTFLPDLGARLLLRTYREFRSAPPPFLGLKPSQPPPVNSPGYALQQRVSFSVVILGYLLYTSIQGYLQAPPNFYDILGVSPDVDEGILKTAFRNFARVNHPDKIGLSGEAAFVAAREAYDTLKSSTKRFAYDRFGSDVVGWAAECTTTSDFIERGLTASSGFYLVTIVAMVLYAIFGQSGFGAFWRYNMFFSLISLELLLVLSPPSNILTYLFPTRVAFQHIRFLHQLFISLSIAITRIGPAILPSFDGGMVTQSEWEQERTVLYGVVKRVTEIAARLDREISRMIYSELRAAHGETHDSADLANQTVTPAVSATNQGEAGQASSVQSTTGTPLRRRGVGKGGDTPSLLASRTPYPRKSGPSVATAALGGLELDHTVMDNFRREVEDMVVERNLRRHPMLAQIWNQGVAAGRAAYEKEREERLFGSRTRPNSQSLHSSVDLSQQLSRDPTLVNSSKQGEGESGWRDSYINRRARSEEHSPSPPASIPSRLFKAPQASLTSTPPPRPLRNLPTASVESNKSGLHRRSSSSSSNGSGLSGLPRPGSALSRSVELERARIRDAALNNVTVSPGSDLNALREMQRLSSRHPSIRKMGSESFPSSPVSAGTPSLTGEGQFGGMDSLTGPAIRSRSMSSVG